MIEFLVLVLEDQQDFVFLLGKLSHLLFTEVLQILISTRLVVNEDFFLIHQFENSLQGEKMRHAGCICK